MTFLNVDSGIFTNSSRYVTIEDVFFESTPEWPSRSQLEDDIHHILFTEIDAGEGALIWKNNFYGACTGTVLQIAPEEIEPQNLYHAQRSRRLVGTTPPTVPKADVITDQSDSRKRKCRWLPFPLWTLLLVLIGAAPCSWLALRMYGARKRRKKAKPLQASGMRVLYDDQHDVSEPPGPG